MSWWIRARDVGINWAQESTYWTWTSLPPELEEVAVLKKVCWLEISVTVELKNLLLKTSYSVYLVFKLHEPYGLNRAIARVMVSRGGEVVQVEESSVLIDRKEKIPGDRGRFPQCRGNGWMELKLGDFFNNLGDDGSVEARLLEGKKLNWKSGLIVKGIEFRPNYY